MTKLHQFIFTIVVSAMLAPLAIVIGTKHGENLRLETYHQESRSTGINPNQELTPHEENPLPIYFSTPQMVEAGRSTYLQLCAGCHGEKGDGKGPAGGAFKPPPRSFLDTESPWKNGLNPTDLYKTLTEGIPGTGMVSFSAMLDEKKSWELIHFIHSLPGMEGRYEAVNDNNLDMVKEALGVS